jgi:hypothetical protein
MPASKTVNAANLEALGAARLAALLIEITTGDAGARRRLRLALAGSAGAGEAAREIGKRLATIAKAKSFIEGPTVKSMAVELQGQRRAILDIVAPADPKEAFELMWRLVGCAEPVFTRSDDGNGRLSEVFDAAARDLGPLAQAAKPAPAALAERAFAALRSDRFGEWEDLVSVLAPVLGKAGLSRLRELLKAWRDEKVARPRAHERRAIGWSSAGPIYADDVEIDHRRRFGTFVLQQIADALGDVDSYIAQIEAGSRKFPHVAAEIAARLLEADRPKEAWAALEAVEPGKRRRAGIEWEQARVDTMEALGRVDEAQDFRWACFLETLNQTHLRAYLAKLPDFEDFEKEQEALDHALSFGNVHHALNFFLEWPDLARASKVVLARTAQLDGDVYELLAPAAQALGEKFPLAATLLRRVMIDFTLNGGLSSRYKHAARHLLECASLAERVEAFGAWPDHAAYARGLRESHGRKSAFWAEVK